MVPVVAVAIAAIVVVVLLIVAIARRRDTVDRAVAHHGHALAAIAQSSRRSGAARPLPQRDSGAPTIESRPGRPPADPGTGQDAEVVDLRPDPHRSHR